MRTIIIGSLLVAAGLAPAAHAAPPGSDPGTPGYLGENLGALPGDSQSDAWDVNAQGHVVGRSYNVGRRTPTLVKAFYWNGTIQRLQSATTAPAGEPSWDSEAWAISNAATETVVGVESRMVCTPDPTDATQQVCSYEQYPLVWEDPGSNPVAVRLGESRGHASGINDSGDLAVGSGAGGLGAIWTRSGSDWVRSNVQAADFPADDLVPSFPDGHDVIGHEIKLYGVAYDVNDAGIVVGELNWVDLTAEEACQQSSVRPCAEDVTYARAYVYFARDAHGVGAGTGRVLPAVPGQGDYRAYALSNVGSVDAVFYAAGVTQVTPDDAWGTGIRWTISLDGSGGPAVEVDVLEQQAWSEGVNEAGHVAGTTNSKTDRRGNIVQTATLFQQSVGYITLKPPKGGSDGASRGMAGVGPIYVVGVANVKGKWQAARWTIP